MERRILSKKYITIHEARKIVEERLKDESNATEVLNRVRNYLMIFGKLDAETSRKAIESLLELGVPLEAAVNILDLCPQSEGEIRSILSTFKETALDPELISNVLSIVRRACG
ncbi:MAG: hypothetical protein QXN05_03490 [Acidilobaceae archaeon]